MTEKVKARFVDAETLLADNPGPVLGYMPIYEVERGRISTAAFVLCSDCGAPIRAMGGPMLGALCLVCTKRAVAGVTEVNAG